MATQKRNKTSKRQRKRKLSVNRSRRLRYFYLNGELHKALHHNRGTDILTAWSYPQHKRVGYTYSDVQKNHQKAFTMLQVSSMINRTRVSIEQAILDGNIPAPQFTYMLDGSDRKVKYMFSEDDVLAAHDYYANLHFGRPRKDGLTNPWPIPTARELRALMRHEIVLYVKTENGFVPTWKAEEF